MVVELKRAEAIHKACADDYGIWKAAKGGCVKLIHAAVEEVYINELMDGTKFFQKVNAQEFLKRAHNFLWLLFCKTTRGEVIIVRINYYILVCLVNSRGARGAICNLSFAVLTRPVDWFPGIPDWRGQTMILRNHQIVTERNNSDQILDRLINWQYLLPRMKLFYILP